MTSTPRTKLLAAIHATAKKQGLDDETYRDKLEQLTGKRSAMELSVPALNKVLDALNGAPGSATQGAHRHAPLDGQRAKARALWIGLYNLGIVRDGSDQALDSFVKGQTGIASLAWIAEPKDARKVVEALKKWSARSLLKGGGGVDWDEHGDPRLCLIRAQWRRLRALDALQLPPEADRDALDAFMLRAVGCRKSVEDLSATEADRAIVALGQWIRQALAKVGSPA
jgi:phage gp16-like protein